MSTILCVPGLLAPFQHPLALDFLADQFERWRPSTVVCVGGLLFADVFPTDAGDRRVAEGDLRAERDALRPFFELFPEALVCEPRRRPLGDLLKAPPGWRWAPDWTVDDILFTCGAGSIGPSAPFEAATSYRRSVVIGQLRGAAGIHWERGCQGRPFFAMNCGCLIEGSSQHFRSRSRTWYLTPGCGVVANGIPSFVPMAIPL
jgi:hypothetical protein